MNPKNNATENKRAKWLEDENGSDLEECFDRAGSFPDCISEVFSDNADFSPTDHDTATEYSNSDIGDEYQEEQMAEYNYLHGKNRF